MRGETHCTIGIGRASSVRGISNLRGASLADGTDT
jgi:hypothetical protein